MNVCVYWRDGGSIILCGNLTKRVGVILAGLCKPVWMIDIESDQDGPIRSLPYVGELIHGSAVQSRRRRSRIDESTRLHVVWRQVRRGFPATPPRATAQERATPCVNPA